MIRASIILAAVLASGMAGAETLPWCPSAKANSLCLDGRGLMRFQKDVPQNSSGLITESTASNGAGIQITSSSGAIIAPVTVYGLANGSTMPPANSVPLLMPNGQPTSLYFCPNGIELNTACVP